jgi:hypothetical protein
VRERLRFLFFFLCYGVGDVGINNWIFCDYCGVHEGETEALNTCVSVKRKVASQIRTQNSEQIRDDITCKRYSTSFERTFQARSNLTGSCDPSKSPLATLHRRTEAFHSLPYLDSFLAAALAKHM